MALKHQKNMKNLFLVLILSIILSCETSPKKEKAEETPQELTTTEEKAYVSFGEAIEAEDAISHKELSELYLGLEIGDTIDVKFSSNVNAVCKGKGCWMRLELSDDKEVMVKFKDYGFFVPKNSDGRNAIVEGLAFIEVTPVDELKHYAEDEGKTQEEIDAIIEPKTTYAFTATGVLVEGTEEDFEGQVEPIADASETEEEE